MGDVQGKDSRPFGGVARAHWIPFGAETSKEGTRFRIFAPAVDAVAVQIDGTERIVPMCDQGGGWFALTMTEVVAGARYWYVLPNGKRVPDFVSRFQPEDVSGPSEVVDAAEFIWEDQGWSGRPWHEAVLYELHVGTFTATGTFLAAIARLEHLEQLGITAIEMMCVADFAGHRNWGYDGVLLYAPDSSYGRPEDLKALINAAHARGIMVLLDVVYNHLGPEGNYLSNYFPEFCRSSEQTPWGQALNFEGKFSEVVREFIVHNALYWIQEFHVDGLRLDAAHTMIDDGPRHILDELADRARRVAEGRHLHLILENEFYAPERLGRGADNEATKYTAQWNHDMTHLLGACMASSSSPYPDRSDMERLGQALARGFVIKAEADAGEPQNVLPPFAFVAFLQTHDLIGNRIFGERIFAIAGPDAVRAAYAILLLLPQIPMIFMGDEFSSSSPFPYFCDFHGELADAVRKGRRDQLAKLQDVPDPEVLKRAPDPEAEKTFLSGKLHWDELAEEPHASWLIWFKRVLRIRHESIVPLLHKFRSGCGRYAVRESGGLTCEWKVTEEVTLRLEANLCGKASGGFEIAENAQLLLLEGAVPSEGVLGPWTIRWTRL